MDLLLGAARWTHIIFGFIGLALFWVPALARKGSPIHRAAGRWWVRCAYVVLGMAALAVVLRLIDLMLLRGIPISERTSLYSFVFFLGYLTLVTYASVHHGTEVLRTKLDWQAYRRPLNRLLAYACIGGSLGIIAFALSYRPQTWPVLVALSPIGFGMASSMLRYHRGAHRSPQREWFYEHLGAMFGAGIAFHTAFAVFGLTRLFDLGLSGYVAVIPWVLPAAIGIPATSIVTRYFRRRFGELPWPDGAQRA